LFFSRAERGFDVRGVATPRPSPARRRPARHVREDREARVLATAQDDAEIVETGLGGGQTGGRICRIKNLAAGTRGEIELGTICGVDENFSRRKINQISLQFYRSLK
jgi:hypothetical protein